MRVQMLRSETYPLPPSGSVTYPAGAHVIVDEATGEEWIAQRIAAPEEVDPVAYIAALEAEDERKRKEAEAAATDPHPVEEA